MIQEYDLTGLSAADQEWKGIRPWISVGGATAAAAVEVYFLGLLIRGVEVDPHLALLGLAVFDACWGLVVYLGFMSAIPYLPGANKLAIDEEGIRFSYPGGRQECLPWRGPGTDFRLFDYSAQPPWVKANLSYFILMRPRFQVLGRWHRMSLLNEEAFAAVLRAARSRGLRITSYQANSLVAPGRPQAYRIRSARQG